VLPDEETCYRAAASRDARFDGRLYLGVTSTGIYCRPSCPARLPRFEHCRWYASAAAAVASGFRACKRCRPDLLPGTRDWDVRGDLAARALRLIRDGVVDVEGVTGLAARLHVSERHLHRVLVAEVGVGPARLARTRRAQTARVLLTGSDAPVTEVAYAAGFGSLRRFTEVMAEEFGMTPSALRASGRDGGHAAARSDREPVPGPPTITVHLPFRPPLAVDDLWAHLGERAVPGLERCHPDAVERLVSAAHGPTMVHLGRPKPGDDRWPVRLTPTDLADLGPVVAALRRWLDLDADPHVIDVTFADDALLALSVVAAPGLRVVGAPDPFEVLLRAIIGQQVSLAAGVTLLGRMAALVAVRRPPVDQTTARTTADLLPWPTPDEVAGLPEHELRGIGLTGARTRAVLAAAQAVADGSVVLDAGQPRDAVRAALCALPGIGPWTADVVLLRGLGDPDAFPAGDLVLRTMLGVTSDVAARTAAARWRPWRGYAAAHLWRLARRAPVSSVTTSRLQETG
jgi:AraC family transcriptional regulator of adaptative response / DNA-3-methyladenine glycosylase II